MRRRFWGLLSLIGVNITAATSPVDTLPNLWKRAGTYLSHGLLEESAAYFKAIEEWYVDESEFLDAEFQKQFLPLSAMAYLNTGRADEGIEKATTYINTFPEEKAYRSFLLYLCGEAQLSQGNPIEANRFYDQFLKEVPDGAEKSIVRWRKVESSLMQNDLQKALELLEEMSKDTTGPNNMANAAIILKDQLSLHSDQEKSDWKSLELLNTLEENHLLYWWLTSLLPAIFENLEQNEQWKLIEDKSSFLVSKTSLENQFTAFESILKNRSESAGIKQSLKTRIWKAHYERMAYQFQKSVELVLENYPKTSDLNLLHLRRLYRSQKLYGALGISKALNQSSELTREETQIEAYRYRIKSARKLKWWDEAIQSLDAFEEQFPDHPDTDRIRFEIYQTLWDSGKRDEAQEKLSQLIQTNPTARDLGNWLFKLGQWQKELKDYAPAKKSFEIAITRLPDSWKPYCEFQIAQVIQSETGPQAAIDYINALNIPKNLFYLNREIKFFVAKANAATQDWKAVQRLCNELLQQSLGDEIETLAFVLKADAYNATGKLQDGMNAFQSALTTESKYLYPVIHDKWIQFIANNAQPERLISELIPFFENSPYHPEWTINHPHYFDRIAQLNLTEFQQEVLYQPLTRLLEDPEYPYFYELFEMIHSSFHPKWQNLTENESIPSSAQWAMKSFLGTLKQQQNSIDLAHSKWIQLAQKDIPQFLSYKPILNVARTLSLYNLPKQKIYWKRVLESSDRDSVLAEAQYHLALIEYNASSHSGIPLLEQVVKRYPESSWSHSARLLLIPHFLITNISQAKNLLDEILNSQQLEPEPKANSLILLANYHFLKNEPEAALTPLNQVIALYQGVSIACEKAFRALYDYYNASQEETHKQQIIDKAKRWNDQSQSTASFQEWISQLQFNQSA